jgi:hypothetical protein
MKLVLAIFIITLVFWTCTAREPKPELEIAAKPVLKFWDTSANAFKLLTDGKLFDSWEIFKAALLKNDFEQLKSLSTDCIHCAVCNSNNYVQWEVFYRKYFIQLFDSVILSRMNDSAKADGHYNNANWHIYAKDCIAKSSDLSKPELIEIWVRVSDRDSFYKGFEGGHATLAFIETASGYKFCGYSTIP